MILLGQGCGGSATLLDPSLGAAETGSPEPTVATPDAAVAAPEPAVEDGSACATNSDCANGQKCSETRQCTATFRCNTDADCSDDNVGRPFCDSWHACEPCRGDVGCPAERPVCTPGWEFGLICAECSVGNSRHCAAGAWCAAQFNTQPNCVVADCQNDRKGPGCTACLNENVELCYGASGQCSQVEGELKACISTAVGDEASSCPVDRIPSRRGCVPPECSDRADAVDACLYDCQAALAICTAH